MTPGRTHIIVIGGGVSGLAAAYRLSDDHRVTLVEGSDRLGGKVRSVTIDDSIVECGADGFVAARPGMSELCAELRLDLVNSHDADGRAAIARGERLIALPAGFRGLTDVRPVALLRTPLLSPAGRLRAALGALRPPPPTSDEISVADVVTRHLGGEAYRSLIEPLITAVFAGDPSRISAGALLARRAPTSPPASASPTPTFRVPVGGMERLVDALAAPIATVSLSTSVTRVAETASGVLVECATGEALTADGVVIATPPATAAHLLRDVAAEAANELAAIRTASTAVIALVIDAPLSFPAGMGHGYVVPRSAGREVVAVTISTRKFPQSAPPGRHVVRVFVGRDGEPNPLDRSDADLIEIARTELQRTLGITATPTTTLVTRWPDAIPQYGLGHQSRIARITHALERHPRVALAGASYGGIGVPDCIRSGVAAAERLRAGLRTDFAV